MAYGSYFPTGYQPYQMPQQVQQPQQIQNGGYMTVRSEDEARNYPIALGNSMTFFNEREPYCYKKTMGFSPLDRPTFERYRIIKEESPDIQDNADTRTNTQESNKNENMRKIENEIDILNERIDRLEKRYESDKSFSNVSADDEQSHAVLYKDGDSARHSKRPESDHPVYAEHRKGNTRSSKQRYADEEQSYDSEYV